MAAVVLGWLAASIALAQNPANTVTNQTQVAAAAQNTFGLRLLAALTHDTPHKNVFVSPSSVFFALDMLELGAAGQTRADIRRTLDIPAAVSEDALHESASALSHALREPKADVELAIANALWSDRKMPLGADFVARCLRLYEASAQSLDFRSPEAAPTINAWVKKNTGGKIPEIVSERTVAASEAILTNAVYFSARWRSVFDESLTQDGAFHHADKSVKSAPLMHQTGLRNSYRSGVGYEAAVLPYGPISRLASEPDFVLCIILPAPEVEVETALAKVDVRHLLDGNEPALLDLKLPRFSLDYGVSLKPALLKMGMGIAFQYPGADFVPMGSRLFFVGDVIHKTRLEVDEKGTVAAAATVITMPAGMARQANPETKVMIVDRPFGLLLCERKTGAVLFAGVVYEP